MFGRFHYLTIANFISNEGREAFESDITRIVNCVNGIFEKLFKSLNLIPFKVRLLGKTLCELSKKKVNSIILLWLDLSFRTLITGNAISFCQFIC